jgi:hypothetical protein
MSKSKLAKIATTLTTVALFVTPVLARSANSANSAAAGSVFAITSLLFTCFMCLIPIVVLAGYILNIFFIIDATKRDFGNDKNALIVWIVVLLFVGFPIGTLLYYFLVIKKYPKQIN